jgi:hypothetical protein
MTEATTLAPPADPEAERKAELMAEGARLGLKFDKRYSAKRMEDLIAEKSGAARSEQVTAFAEQASAVVDESRMARGVKPHADIEAVASLQEQLEAMKRRNAELEALAAKSPEAPAQPYNAPKGMLTSAQISGTGALQREEDEKRVLMDRCAQVGIAHKVPPRANVDAIRDILGRHMAERAQKLAAEEGAARLKAAGPPEVFVSMRVLPLGDKKISKGIHVPGFGDEVFSRGDVIENVPLATAKAHEANGMGEILSA